MVKEKKTVHRIQMTEGKRQIIQQLLQEYNIETTADIQAALRDLLGGTIKEIFRNITLKPPLIYRQPSEIF